MNQKDMTLRIEKIREGTVIDHIKAGTAIRVLNILNLDGKDGKLITVGINVNSKKLGEKKDIIKVEDVFLDNKQLNQIALVAPRSTITYIENFSVKKKFTLEVPPKFIDIFPCPNENCISNKEREPVKSEFDTLIENPLKIRCVYCGRVLFAHELPNVIKIN